MRTIAQWKIKNTITVEQYEDYSYRVTPESIHRLISQAGGVYGHILSKNPMTEDLDVAIRSIFGKNTTMVHGQINPENVRLPKGVIS